MIFCLILVVGWAGGFWRFGGGRLVVDVDYLFSSSNNIAFG